MVKKCFICSKEIQERETIILTLEGACCTTCKDTEKYKDIMHKAKKESLAILNRHFD